MPKPPRPLPAFVAALIAHVALLVAPDQEQFWLSAVAYFIAALNVLLAGQWLRGSEELTGGARLASMAADTLVMVGAGYSTQVPPGVIKLGGVLPLGWSCIVVLLWLDQLNCKRLPWALLLAPAVLLAFLERVFNRPPLVIEIALTVILAVSLLRSLLACRRKA